MTRKLTKEELGEITYAFPVETEFGVDLVCIMTDGRACGFRLEGENYSLGIPVNKRHIILHKDENNPMYATIEK